MTESFPKKPSDAAGKKSGNQADDRRARQAEQLRENLRRRKAQARARDAGQPADSGGDAPKT